MAAVINDKNTAAGLFKRVYKDLREIIPEGHVGLELFPHSDKVKMGEKIMFPIVLSNENGLSCGDGSQITFADAQAGTIKQAELQSYEYFLSSGILTKALADSAAGGEAAVKAASKHVVNSNLKSLMRFLENDVFYGKDAYGIGRVSYETKTFRGATLTAGAGTVGGVTFATGGVDTTNNKILINTSDQAPGLFMGCEGMEVEEWSGDAIVSGKTGYVKSYDVDNGILEVSFTPTAASGASSHYLVIKAKGRDTSFLGAKGILSTSGTLFGIVNTTYKMWKGNSVAITGKLTWKKILPSLSLACAKGLESDATIVVSFEGWANLLADIEALRSVDSSFSPDTLKQGARNLEFSFLNGKITVKPCRFVRRGDAFILAKGQLHRYGSSDIALKVPGIDDGDLLVKPITTNVFVFRSYADQAVFIDHPAQNVYISGIDPESAT